MWGRILVEPAHFSWFPVHRRRDRRDIRPRRRRLREAYSYLHRVQVGCCPRRHARSRQVVEREVVQARLGGGGVEPCIRCGNDRWAFLHRASARRLAPHHKVRVER